MENDYPKIEDAARFHRAASFYYTNHCFILKIRRTLFLLVQLAAYALKYGGDVLRKQLVLRVEANLVARVFRGEGQNGFHRMFVVHRLYQPATHGKILVQGNQLNAVVAINLYDTISYINIHILIIGEMNVLYRLFG